MRLARVFPLIFLALSILACHANKSLKNSDLIGDWRVVAVEENGKDIMSRRQAFMRFEAERVWLVEGSEREEATYRIEGQTIILVDEVRTHRFEVRERRDGHMVLYSQEDRLLITLQRGPDGQ